MGQVPFFQVSKDGEADPYKQTGLSTLLY